NVETVSVEDMERRTGLKITGQV
ncbi:MAG TPA: hypothetical protein PLH31_06150, partial [Caulobacter sp.]|nr:hypothetical protein [Caulobacter sp.]